MSTSRSLSWPLHPLSMAFLVISAGMAAVAVAACDPTGSPARLALASGLAGAAAGFANSGST